MPGGKWLREVWLRSFAVVRRRARLAEIDLRHLTGAESAIVAEFGPGSKAYFIPAADRAAKA